MKSIGKDADGGWAISSYLCPSCKKMNLFLIHADQVFYGVLNSYGNIINIDPIRPRGSIRSPCPNNVPNLIAEDYIEACMVLPDSSKASAALSRRCLQNLLSEAAKVKPGNLADEIQQVIDGKS
jgi:hypothetical protein